MADAGKVAIATLVMRNKEYLVAIRPEEDALALHTMYFADEVRSPDRDLELPDTGDVSDRELSMAHLLIESMESEWDPARYHDTYREKVEALVEEKRNGHEIVVQAGPEPGQGRRPDGCAQRQHRRGGAAREPRARSERPQPSERLGGPPPPRRRPSSRPAPRPPAAGRLPEPLRAGRAVLSRRVRAGVGSIARAPQKAG